MSEAKFIHYLSDTKLYVKVTGTVFNNGRPSPNPREEPADPGDGAEVDEVEVWLDKYEGEYSLCVHDIFTSAKDNRQTSLEEELKEIGSEKLDELPSEMEQ